MTVILSSGFGRLHLAQSADWLSKAGLNVQLLCGWVPKNPDSWFVRLCSKIVGRDLSPGLKKRIIMLKNGGEVRPCAWADFLCQGIFLFDAHVFHGRFHNVAAQFAWTVFGWQTRRSLLRLKNHRPVIFHVRSGAGQGGAIRIAHKHGIKVLVDHSALHPEQSEVNLSDDCKRWGVPLPISPHAGVWRNVMADCLNADIIMVNANHIRDSFVDRGYDPEKIKVVYLGVRDDFRDVNIERIASGCQNEIPHVLFTGNVSLLKGIEYLLGSLRVLRDRNIMVHYDVVGSISAPKALLNMYKDFPVTFYGPVPNDDIKNFLAKSDIYLFPSLADGCAQSGMEALTAGLPVVATYQSGLPITDGETGCIVPMKDAEAIADKVEWLINHPEERQRIGQNASKMMKTRFTWEKYAENVKQIYKEMIGDSCNDFI